jgi:hypothetical protein
MRKRMRVAASRRATADALKCRARSLRRNNAPGAPGGGGGLGLLDPLTADGLELSVDLGMPISTDTQPSRGRIPGNGDAARGYLPAAEGGRTDADQNRHTGTPPWSSPPLSPSPSGYAAGTGRTGENAVDLGGKSGVAIPSWCDRYNSSSKNNGLTQWLDGEHVRHTREIEAGAKHRLAATAPIELLQQFAHAAHRAR